MLFLKIIIYVLCIYLEGFWDAGNFFLVGVAFFLLLYFLTHIYNRCLRNVLETDSNQCICFWEGSKLAQPIMRSISKRKKCICDKRTTMYGLLYKYRYHRSVNNMRFVVQIVIKGLICM